MNDEHAPPRTAAVVTAGISIRCRCASRFYDSCRCYCAAFGEGWAAIDAAWPAGFDSVWRRCTAILQAPPPEVDDAAGLRRAARVVMSPPSDGLNTLRQVKSQRYSMQPRCHQPAPDRPVAGITAPIY